MGDGETERERLPLRGTTCVVTSDVWTFPSHEVDAPHPASEPVHILPLPGTSMSARTVGLNSQTAQVLFSARSEACLQA